MRKLSRRYSIFRPITLYPVLDKELKKAADKYDRIAVIEMNDGQYKREIERILKRDIEGISILGGTISLKEIRERLNDI